MPEGDRARAPESIAESVLYQPWVEEQSPHADVWFRLPPRDEGQSLPRPLLPFPTDTRRTYPWVTPQNIARLLVPGAVLWDYGEGLPVTIKRTLSAHPGVADRYRQARRNQLTATEDLSLIAKVNQGFPNKLKPNRRGKLAEEREHETG